MNTIDELTINTIRILSIEQVQKANSGHPGMPMGSAPMAYTLWAKYLKHSPKNPKWAGRDRFILSAGHGSALLYSLLHLFGYGLTIEDLKNFRQWQSMTPGHPEYGHTPGVEITTGPLGQGISNAVGMAIAETYMANKFNRPGYSIVDNYTYAIVGDGCLMEGISSEACSLAGTLKLGKLIALYDSNNISIEGGTDIAFTENVGKRFEAYGWQVLRVEDGNNVDEIGKAIEEAKADKERPSLIIVKTTIGYGCPEKQGKASAHGEPLGEKNVDETKKFLGWNYDKEFYVPDEVRKYMDEVISKLNEEEDKWNVMFENYRKEYPELADEWDRWHSEKLPVDLINDEGLWNFKLKTATRSSSGEILNYLVKLVPNLIGGSADLAPSTKTYTKDRGDYSSENRSGSNFHFGVREHAMGAIANGIAAYGGLIPYVSTFLVFSDYMKGAVRLSALMKLPVIYVYTHDSIGVGEDGPTHEPIEHLPMLRSIPNLTVIRPADSKEVSAAWCYALNKKDGPTALILTRQNLPVYEETSKEALKGGYILCDAEGGNPDIILMASGSEVNLVYEACKQLKEKGIKARVVSMPSMEIFDQQSEEYKKMVLPDNVRARIAVEAASTMSWYKYVGLDGCVIGLDHFGASAPGDILFKEFGFTVENVVNKALELLKK
ncbi:transketolase [Thermoanaerobacterium thermosaccharolyticum]|uniref:Transketolase n=1 Tax=Thermoanaerobacterium thermosaccharolyticum TaxID=1517 RepID=A0A231VCV4_THETR|nr:transketolase [Thermoanaerobacterium thermosaccharolyticum]OXT06015.1 transketolase [Thermoanaerobacterium thermosaccharolyticum]